MRVCDRNASGARRIAPNAFLSIDETGLVTIVASRSEMANVPMPSVSVVCDPEWSPVWCDPE
jgi:hypothetical protein